MDGSDVDGLDRKHIQLEDEQRQYNDDLDRAIIASEQEREEIQVRQSVSLGSLKSANSVTVVLSAV